VGAAGDVSWTLNYRSAEAVPLLALTCTLKSEAPGSLTVTLRRAGATSFCRIWVGWLMKNWLYS
jgi:hypothetical protein